jgi:hypothetical protein
MKTKYYAFIWIQLIAFAVMIQCMGSLKDWNLDSDEVKAEAYGKYSFPQRLKIFWGSETNIFWSTEIHKVKAGLSVQYFSNKTFRASSDSNTITIPIRCIPLLMDDSTNDIKLPVFDLPPVKSRYKMELTDEKGNIVKKTAKGEVLGKITPYTYKPSPDPKTGVIIDTGWRPARYTLLPQQARSLNPPFMLQDYFEITNSGTYHLHFELCAFKPISDTNELIQFPSVDAEINIKLNGKTN